MKSKLSILFIIFCFLSCKDSLNDKGKRNQNWVWWVDANTTVGRWIPFAGTGLPVKNGRYTHFYFNGNKYCEGKLVNGNDADTVFYYDINGHIQKYKTLKQDSARYFIHDGLIKIFEPNGRLAEAGVVKNHTYGDYWVSYFENGRPLYVRDLKNDTGWATRYYDNGRVEDSIYFEGRASSTIKHWYENGLLESAYNYSHGDYNGLGKKYFPSGKLKAMATYVNGKISGEEEFWYEDSKIHAIAHKNNGVLNGKQIVYYENGVIQLEYNAKDDKVDGEVKKRNEDGTLVGDRIYKDGVLIENKMDGRLGPFPAQQQAPLQ